MSLILNIDCSGSTASVCLSENKTVLVLSSNSHMQDHAAWIHTAIAGILKKVDGSYFEPEAVAVTIGPGSYTGLRVGLATAKGICFAKKIPLIAISTLEILALSVKDEVKDLVCPMIDARRDEVFTAVYSSKLDLIQPPAPMILNQQSFEELLQNHQVLFCGSGSKKLQLLNPGANASFSDKEADASHLAHIANDYHQLKRYADLAYAEPEYLKAFYSPGH